MERTVLSAGVGLAAVMAVILVMSFGTAVHAQGEGNPPLLEGAWLVNVQVRDCATQAPLGPPFMSLVTFHEGGTLTELAGSPAFAAGQRSAGTGTWVRTGARTYLQRVAALVHFTTVPNPPFSPGFDAGGLTITHTVELLSGRSFVSSGTNAFYRTGELTPYRTGCSTAAGTRF